MTYIGDSIDLNMLERKLLICLPSPRDNKAVADVMAALPHDKYWVKYTPYAMKPYTTFRDFFLKRTQYTHLAIAPDDCVYTLKGVERLWEDAKEYDPIMGYSHVDKIEGTNEPDLSRASVSINLPSKDYRLRKWVHPSVEQIRDIGITFFPWVGTPFTIMSRGLVEKIPFPGDKKWRSEPGAVGWNYDLQISHDVREIGHSNMWVDTHPDCFFIHDRDVAGAHKNTRGKTPKGMTTWWDKVGEERIFDAV
jgi:hypothetical protein